MDHITLHFLCMRYAMETKTELLEKENPFEVKLQLQLNVCARARTHGSILACRCFFFRSIVSPIYSKDFRLAIDFLANVFDKTILLRSHQVLCAVRHQSHGERGKGHLHPWKTTTITIKIVNNSSYRITVINSLRCVGGGTSSQCSEMWSKSEPVTINIFSVEKGNMIVGACDLSVSFFSSENEIFFVPIHSK